MQRGRDEYTQGTDSGVPSKSRIAERIIHFTSAALLILSFLSAASPDRVTEQIPFWNIGIFLIGWMTMPILIAVDIRLLKESSDWSPSTRYWIAGALLPVVNLGVVLTYLLRRRDATGQEPCSNWHLVAVASLILSTASFLAVGMVSDSSPNGQAIVDAGVIVGFTFSAAVPASVAFDVRYLNETREWDGDPIGWALLVLTPLINVCTLLVYIALRRADL
jgi:hypothetical protein